jgi:hypothetical protein
MNHLGKSFCLSLVWLGLLGLKGSAQDAAPLPDPSHVVFLAPDKIKWEGTGGQRHMDLVGDPSKPGLYVRLAEWLPGNMSRPHHHSAIRYFYVASGTWWVGSTNTYDPEKTYPMRAGTFVTHFPGKAHFDGAKTEPGLLVEIGEGPIVTTACKQASDCPQ